MEEQFWQQFLEDHTERGAHTHSEGSPPDIILEIQTSPGSQSWLVVDRPQGTDQTDAMLDEMCREMIEKMRKHDKYNTS